MYLLPCQNVGTVQAHSMRSGDSLLQLHVHTQDMLAQLSGDFSKSVNNVQVAGSHSFSQ